MSHACAPAMTALLSLAAGQAWGVDKARCVDIQQSTFTALKGCSSSDGALTISPAALGQLQFDKDGLAALRAGNQFFYVHRSGRQLPVITYDNGPDYFNQGLVRGLVNGKVAFFNTQLLPAFPGQFDWAFPFANGVAEVCNGCSLGPPDQDGHRGMQGSQWFKIDLQGHVTADSL